MCAALKAFPLHVMVRQVLQNVRYAWVEEILSISTESIFWNESFSRKSKEQMLMHIFHLLHRFYANAEGKPPRASVHIVCPVLYCVHFVCIVWWRLKRGYHNLFYSFIGLIGHNTWWENSWNGSFGPKTGQKIPSEMEVALLHKEHLGTSRII